MHRMIVIATLLGMVVGCNASSTAVPAGGGPQVEIVTNMGKIKCELFEKESPGTVKNFLKYVDDKHYDGTIFHRVMPDFMIQGGGFDPDLKERPTRDPIRNEAGNGVENRIYTLAMARTNAPHSATSQFFINVKDNEFLNRAKSQDGVGYTVFGRVLDGKDVVDAIKRQLTNTVPVQMALPDGRVVDNPMENVPKNAIVIESIRRIP
jgi:peptidyl-prolyl cis-trans isomerase B (cyclophilin B)